MKYRFHYLREMHEVDVGEGEGGISLTIGDKKYTIEEIDMQDNAAFFKMQGRGYKIFFVRDDAKIHLSLNGEYFTLELGSGTRYGSEGTDQLGGNVIASSMPGLLVKVPVQVGEQVKSGDTLAIVEAMKMQNELRTPIDGTVKKINFREGQQVDAFEPIVEIEQQ